MICWQLVCLLCFNLWRTQVLASPITVNSQTGSHSADENTIHSIPHQYSHDNPRLKHPNVPDHSMMDHPPFLNEGVDEFNSVHGKHIKRKPPAVKTTRIRRTPTGFSARGFHEEAFDRDFGHFSPVKRSEIEKRRPESDAAGFYGDTFSNGFGEFETMKRKYKAPYAYKGINIDVIDPRYLPENLSPMPKRRPEMTKTGFDSDVFNSGFGEFHPMKK